MAAHIKSILKRLTLAALLLFVVLYAAIALLLAMKERPLPAAPDEMAGYRTVTIFGASGTAGDGILKAALADTSIDRVHVITRRATPRIEEGVATGKVLMTRHLDYMDYTAVLDQVSDSDAVYWAIGISSIGMDEETYAKIHVDFPLMFLKQWAGVRTQPDASFHYISSSDISESSTRMWARQKLRAEKILTGIASEHGLKVIAYRPDYIGPTREEAHLGQTLLFWFFRPLGAAVRAKQIGQAMLEVSARVPEFENGDKVGTGGIILYSDAYEQRQL